DGAELLGADLHALPDRVFVRKELLGGGRAEDADGVAAVVLHLREELPALGVQVDHVEELRLGADGVGGRREDRTLDHLLSRIAYAHALLQPRQALHAQKIRRRQTEAQNALRAAGSIIALRRLGRAEQDVGRPELSNLLQRG